MSSTGGKRGAGAFAFIARVIVGCSSPAPTPPAPGTPGQACAEPRATASPPTAERGDTITVEGVDWEACNDTPNDRTPDSWGDLSLEWVQSGATADLGKVTPSDGAFRKEITVPDDALLGRTVIRVIAPEFTLELSVSIETDPTGG